MASKLDVILGKIDDLPKYYGLSRDYVDQLKHYTRQKEQIVMGEVSNDFPYMQSFDSKDGYLKWYAESVLDWLGSMELEGNLTNSSRKTMRTLHKIMPPLLGDVAFLPIIEEEVYDCVTASGSRIVKPYVITPNGEKFPLLKDDNKRYI
ncbi:hypothetical protein HOD05_02780 [Candidatus Woesearchaeota archaeon]|jgi:hypothetical protein|nr:hypothetical protein [Candidatus Woesearchaeota archaeon]MBT4151297.1 hypothetical protein [Candidatus Woesearchaeota archaeon]MBT4247466.1 hypothetical protein [Candidatus Woesearchaeota archaeon]MBT4434119.1 hypothetical protein [Candidatus Woesearchaeota archaeon]MBT7332242.1 hypothetical protein [Candidatus Woesearchaeota archaeon]